jgi:Fe2+ transport system protein B
VRSRSNPSAVKRFRRLLTSPFMGFVIFILLIVLAMLAWFCFSSSAPDWSSSFLVSSSPGSSRFPLVQ